MAASVQQSRRRSSAAYLGDQPLFRSLTGGRGGAPLAEERHAVECVLDDKSDRVMNGAFGELGRFANQIHGHADARDAWEIGTEVNILFSGNAESVIEQADGVRWIDGG